VSGYFRRHRRDHVDEWHVCHDCTIQFRRHIHDARHQQATSTAAAREDAARIRVALADQVTGHVDEVGEAVALFEQPALVVPAPTTFLPAADLRDGINESAIEQ
jgi:hypothetical protein